MLDCHLIEDLNSNNRRKGFALLVFDGLMQRAAGSLIVAFAAAAAMTVALQSSARKQTDTPFVCLTTPVFRKFPGK